MPAIDIADDTYIGVPPGVLAPIVADPGSWALWWPDLVLDVTADRGIKGVQWEVQGPLAGSMEIWLEPVGRGTVVHWFLRAEPVPGVRRSRWPGRSGAAPSPRRQARDRDRRARAWKAHAFALKDRLEWAERVT